MTVYEPSKTPTTPGLFIRNRSNVRSRRTGNSRKDVDHNDNEIISESLEVSKSRPRRSRYSSEFDHSANLQSKSEEILLSTEYGQRRRTYSNDWEKRHNRKNSYEDNDFLLDDDDEEDFQLPSRPVSRRDFERKSEVFTSRSRSRAGFRAGPMETLDRKISASTDNLDTLKREKRSHRMWQDRDLSQRPRSVSSRNKELSKGVVNNNDDVTFRINGEKMSKNRYFFGGELKSALKNTKKTKNPPLSNAVRLHTTKRN